MKSLRSFVVDLLDFLRSYFGPFKSVSPPAPTAPWAWGDNSQGQLGNSTNYLAPFPTLSPAPVSGLLAGAVDIAAGGYHSLVLLSDGTVWAWGQDSHGQVGYSGAPPAFQYVPALAHLPGQRAVAIAAGFQHSLAVAGSGNTVYTWGNNLQGQLGWDSMSILNATHGPVPRQVWTGQNNAPPAFSNAVAVAGGRSHSLALKVDGTVWAWGDNGLGQLSVDPQTVQMSFVPVQVTGLKRVRVKAVAAGGCHSLALDLSGRVWAWGNNLNGELGIGNTNKSPVPVQVTGLRRVKAIAAGESHSMALDSDDRVWAWGRNFDGQLGNPGRYMTIVPTLSPVLAVGITRVKAIAAGARHSLAVKRDGTVWTWGLNDFGQLGIGAMPPASSAYPCQVMSNPTAVPPVPFSLGKAVAGGGSHSLALK